MSDEIMFYWFDMDHTLINNDCDVSWKEYVVTNGHGNNKSLKELIDEDWEYACKYFQFSILMLLPKTVTSEEAIRKEQLFKQKLGTNSFGLNNN